jgi:very-short-patch-repair endonuclease
MSMATAAPSASFPAPPASDRRHRILQAKKEWIKQLTDLSGNNNLLYYRDLKRGTLDLAGADDAPLRRLLAGQRVRCSQLFADPALRSDAAARLRAIYRRIRLLDEQYGISTGCLAAGLVSWREPQKSPAAPLLLYGVSLKPTSVTREDFELVLREEPATVNLVLLRKLESLFGVAVPAGPLAERADAQHVDPVHAYERLAELAADDVPGLSLAHRLVISTFCNDKLPMTEELRDADDLLIGSDVVAALAGAADALPAWQTGAYDGEPDATVIPPPNEFLVCDADRSQTRVINAVLRGRHLVIEGPPGTGKSQTIANMIAALIAADKKVLFVAEKRAAIDAVLKYLDRDDRGLASLVLDVHDRDLTKRAIAKDLAAALNATSEVQEPATRELHRSLVGRRDRLDAHADAVNRPRAPWGVSFFDAQSRLLGIPEPRRSAVRIPAAPLSGLAGDGFDHSRDALTRLADIQQVVKPPWAGARLPDDESARQAGAVAQRLHTLMPDARKQLAAIRMELDIPAIDAYRTWRNLYQHLLNGVASSHSVLGADIFQADLTSLVTATATRAQRRAAERQPVSWLACFALRRQARSRWRGAKPTRSQLYEALAAAEQQLRIWRDSNIPGVPALPANWASAASLFTDLDSCVRKLDGVLAGKPLASSGLTALHTLATELAEDAGGATHVAALCQLSQRLAAAGLAGLIDEVCRRDADGDQAAALFDSAWCASIVAHVRGTDPRCTEGGGTSLDRTVDEFRRRDIAHLKQNAQRIRFLVARRVRDAQATHATQARLLRLEAGKSKMHRPLRKLIDDAPDVLLALKPCVAISPILVSQKLPLRRLFDVVIFDEASQVESADAVPSLMRASQVVVAGDTKQLPPTNFFRMLNGDDYDDAVEPADDETSPLSLVGSEFESILSSLRAALPQKELRWHYRSRDERLIAFSNRHFYRLSLITFPGVGTRTDDCLTHVVAEQDPGIGGQEKSAAAEVDRVVELILKHAAARPRESLGVITLGSTHRDRIDAKLRHAQADRADLSDFFDPDNKERFFVKSLEEVQGDERDAIILTVGYCGRRTDGRVRHSWGPITNEGGERRLNVAITRARSRLTIVTSFRTEETDPSGLRHAGGKLLCEYLRYVDSGGSDIGSPDRSESALNPFELDVKQRLESAGIAVTPQYGVGRSRIDFAAAHPRFPSRMVLAIEADGASYHSSHTARDRDRLRQQALEKLGWKFHRIWSTDWFTDPDSEVAKVRAAYDRAVRNSDNANAEATQ